MWVRSFVCLFVQRTLWNDDLFRLSILLLVSHTRYPLLWLQKLKNNSIHHSHYNIVITREIFVIVSSHSEIHSTRYINYSRHELVRWRWYSSTKHRHEQQRQQSHTRNIIMTFRKKILTPDGHTHCMVYVFRACTWTNKTTSFDRKIWSLFVHVNCE